MQKFQDTIDTLRRISEDLKQQGIVVEHLNTAIEELNRHHENIARIEKNIQAIKDEVIAPVKAELEANKVAGKFSIFGFWVGGIGLVVSVFAIAMGYFGHSSKPLQSVTTAPPSVTTGPQSNVEQMLSEIMTNFLFPKNLTLTADQFEVEEYEFAKLMQGVNDRLELRVLSINPPGYREYPKARAAIILFKNGRALSKKAVESQLRQGKTLDEALRRKLADNESQATVEEGDVLVLGSYSFHIDAVFSKAPGSRAIGDGKSSVVFRAVKSQAN
jgi:hypothetical protein